MNHCGMRKAECGLAKTLGGAATTRHRSGPTSHFGSALHSAIRTPQSAF